MSTEKFQIGGFAGVLQRRDRVREVVLRAGQRCQVPNSIERTLRAERHGNIAFLEVKPRVTIEVGKIPARTGDKIIQPENLMSGG